VDSDHQPIVVWVKENEKEKGKHGREIGGKETRIRWSVDKGKELEEVLREIEVEKERRVEQEWKEMKERIERIFKKYKKEVGKGNRRGWWDEECREKKKKVRRELRKWRRKDDGDKNGYVKGKGRYRKLCEMKRRKKMKDGKKK